MKFERRVLIAFRVPLDAVDIDRILYGVRDVKRVLGNGGETAALRANYQFQPCRAPALHCGLMPAT